MRRYSEFTNLANNPEKRKKKFKIILHMEEQEKAENTLNRLTEKLLNIAVSRMREIAEQLPAKERITFLILAGTAIERICRQMTKK